MSCSSLNLTNLMYVAVFHVIDRDGYKIRDQQVLRYIQEVSNLFFNCVFLFLRTTDCYLIIVRT